MQYKACRTKNKALTSERNIKYRCKPYLYQIWTKKQYLTEVKYYLFLKLLFDDFSCFVSSANFAYVVSQFQLSALFTFHHARHNQLKVGATFVTACFRRSTLWYCHVFHLLVIFLSACSSEQDVFCCNVSFEKVFQPSESRIDHCVVATAGAFVQVLSAFLTKTKTVCLAQYRIR